VISQLVTAYTTQNLALFKDLFSSQLDFRFYVPPSFVPTYESKAYANPPDTIEGNLSYYWKLDDEEQATDNLFSYSQQIQFTSYSCIVDSCYSGQSLCDTLHPLVRMVGGTITITLPDNTEYDIDIGEQWFILSRDPLNATLWVITKWFDKGTAL
jgi:hypothetical protein